MRRLPKYVALLVFFTLQHAPFITHAENSAPDGTQADEICDNGRDDDGDGLVDLNDPDCTCAIIQPKSLIPNPSFEAMNCCPQSQSQLNCADTWIQASEPTTDYLHTCGWMGWQNLPPPLPFPDGEAVVGFRNGRFNQMADPQWKEYAGACLLGPLKANTAYKFKFWVGFTDAVNSPPTNIVFYGATDCASLPFGKGNTAHGCPLNGPGWVELGRVPISGNKEWLLKEINVTPKQNIHAMAIGPDCDVSATAINPYYFFDNLVLDEQRNFDYVISAKGYPCTNQFFLDIPVIEGYAYQWYKDGVALVGETKPTLQVKTGEGKYQVRISDEEGCKVTQAYNHLYPRSTNFVAAKICPGTAYDFNQHKLSSAGEYIDTVKTIHNCDSIVRLSLSIEDDLMDTVQARILEGEQFKVGTRLFGSPGEFLSTLKSTIGCDSTVLLHLDFYRIFFPTGFSPNDDGKNDRFGFYGGSELKRIVAFHVFDRWGGMAWSVKDVPPGDSSAFWDGTIRSEAAPVGLYTYVVTLLLEDGREHVRYGGVTLVR
ncbi:MAG TPA: gliding motility-associated C-terminal domain-containing protein [Haliscomenobacter sp.]|uniref:T9SS type B sorting domain-containing protein n=1 Tax=Haliscomenobacter sp. TaxID=2717303 RepID=UPI002BB556F6|nr:gliding motility-associated C-terminal domain-containing protein [Haliscomenobacter sp.]HOY19409.1 gliding motility-associated C-terminal domain-containing protein [Haliscomenobacter sp.]